MANHNKLKLYSMDIAEEKRTALKCLFLKVFMEEKVDIVPPYKTGKEFIYPNRFSEILQTYLGYDVVTNLEVVSFW